MGLSIRKGDSVLVISGRYKGVTGHVLEAYPKRDKVLVERVNLVKKHMKPRGQTQPGGIIEKEMPIHVSNVMLVDEKKDQASRFKNVRTEGGAKVRISKRTGNEV